MQESLQGAPELTDVPKNIKTLFTNTASFGSQIRDLGATVDILKEANTKLHDVQTMMQQNLTNIQVNIDFYEKTFLQNHPDYFFLFFHCQTIISAISIFFGSP